MYGNRYQPRSVDPRSLSLSVGIVGSLVAAAMLSTTVVEVLIKEKPPLITYTVPPITPPPPPVDKAKPEVDRPVPPVPTTPEPRVETPPQPDQPPIAQPDPGPGPIALDTNGTGGTGGATIDPPKPPPPVLTRADIDPRYLRDFQPLYPPAEQRAGSEGVVSLRVLIGVDGRVRQVEKLASPSDAFWRATEQRALAKWRFKPATRDGVPYESWKEMTVRFRIDS